MDRNTVFMPHSDRYAFDFGPCRPSEGYAQLDTHQDASYFGVWINPTRRSIVTFAEGDMTFVVCDPAEFTAEVVRAITFYDTPETRCRIDVMSLPVTHPLREAFVEAGLASYLH